MAAEDVASDECQPAAEHLARAFGFLGKRWTAIILGHLSHGPAGFRDLSRGIGGISDSVLSERLGDLAGGGLITRTVRDGPPVTVTGHHRQLWPHKNKVLATATRAPTLRPSMRSPAPLELLPTLKNAIGHPAW